MPIYYSQNCIQTTQKKLKKYMKKIENYYLRDHIKYNYIKKFYKIFKTKKSMMPSLHQDIISFIKNDSSTHKRFVRPTNTSLIQTITEIGEAVNNIVIVNSSESESNSDSDNNNSNSSDSEESESSEY